MPKTCAKCGKNVRWLCWTWDKKEYFPEFYNKTLCNDCGVDLNKIVVQEDQKLGYEKPFLQADEQGMRLVTINDSVLSEDGIGKHLKLHTDAAQKYGYSFVNLTQTPARYVIYMAMVFEKKNVSVPKLVECTYCKATYDLNKYFKCPNCSAVLNK